MEFVNALGALLIILGALSLAGYAVRHRGAIVKWINNINHEANKDEKQDQIIELRRTKEDVERRLEKLEK